MTSTVPLRLYALPSHSADRPAGCIATVDISRVDDATAAFEIASHPAVRPLARRLAATTLGVDDPKRPHLFAPRYELYRGDAKPTMPGARLLLTAHVTTIDGGAGAVGYSMAGGLMDGEEAAVHDIVRRLAS